MAGFRQEAGFLDRVKKVVSLGQSTGCFRVPGTVPVARDGIGEGGGRVRKTVS